MQDRGSVSPKGVVAAAALLTLGLAACAEGPLAPTTDGAPSAASVQDRGPLERIQFVHYPRGFAQPPNAGGGGGGGSTGSLTCYAFIGGGAPWRTAEPWEIYNGSDDGITSSDLLSQISTAVSGWESAAGSNIAGDGSFGVTDVDLNTTDNHNVVKFGNLSQNGAIAVTNVWGYFRGPRTTREIVEWDMILDDVDFGWALNGSPAAMDVLNITAHEVGHALGMDHPAGGCTEETMYAYAANGETKKRTLNAGDIAGIRALY